MNKPTASPQNLALLLLLLSGICLPLLLPAQTNHQTTIGQTAYPQQWETIDSLIEDGLFQSALQAVDRLQQQARQDKNSADLFKATIFLNSLKATLQETPYPEIIEGVQEALKQASGLEKSLFEFMLAQIYQAYLSENRWKMQDQTALNPNEQEISWQQMSPAQLQEQILTLYYNSLQEASLKTTPAENYSLLWQNTNANASLRPTLYDVLTHQVINYLQDASTYLSTPREIFRLPDSVYFADLNVFLSQDFTSSDHSHLKARALQLFQDLLRFRKTQNQLPALIDLDLHRLQFARKRTQIAQADAYFLAAINRLIEQYGYQEGMARVHLEKADYLLELGQRYSRDIPNDPNRWALKAALEHCQQLLAALPNDPIVQEVRQMISTIEKPFLEVRSEEVLLPQRPGLAKISYQNSSTVYLKLVSLDFDTRLKLAERPGSMAPKVASRPTIHQWQVKLPNTEDYQQHSIETKIPALPNGQYALVFSNHPGFDTSLQSTLLEYYSFSVSSIAYFWRSNQNGKTTFVLTDRATGQPLSGVKANIYEHNYNRRGNRPAYKVLENLRSDEKGFIHTQSTNQSFFVQFCHGPDSLITDETFYNSRPYEREDSYERTTFFLDRAIYRPGQTIYFKGIATQHRRNQDDQIQLLTNRDIEVLFRDANYQVVARQTFTTNEYGTFNGQFTIPTQLLTGMMSLESNAGGRIRFRVEEYKRPRFEVDLEELQQAYQLGDTVTLNGSASTFAGSVLDQAEVVYRVSRQDLQPFPWYRHRYGFFAFPGYGQTTEIAYGRTTTDSTGRFSIDFAAMPNPEIPARQRPRFHFKVEVDIIDRTGETQSTSRSITLAYTGLVARLEMPDEVDRNSQPAPWRIITEDHNGSARPANGQLNIYRLTTPGQTYKARYWELPTEAYPDSQAFAKDFPDYALHGVGDWSDWPRVLVKEFAFSTTNDNWFNFPVDSFSVGDYLLELQCQDAAGNSISYRQSLRIVDSAAKRIPAQLLFWKNTPTTPLAPGATLQLPLATNTSLQVLLEIERKGNIIRQEWISLENWTEISQAITEADRGNLQIQLSYIYQNRAYSEMANILVPYTNKELHFEYATFRDKLYPGQPEEWTITISGEQKDAIAAEMVATLYDASLDQFVPHQWHLNYYNTNNQLRFPWRSRLFNAIAAQVGSKYRYFSAGKPNYPYLQLFLHPEQLHFKGGRATNYNLELTAMAAARTSDSTAKAMAEADTEAQAAAAVPPPEAPESPSQPTPVQIRTNLEETVFFKPELRTDSEGNVRISFTMNDALSRWRFLGFAHTTDLKTGITEREIVTQKELMVFPNPPRFVREGDQFEFSAKVSNLIDKDLAGTASLQFFDPLTQKEVTEMILQENSDRNFFAKAGQSDYLGWKIRIPYGRLSALSYRIIVQSDNFSDGEANSLPVLTNRILVTETLPISLRGLEKKELSFVAMQQSLQSPTAQGQLFQLDFTGNPAWLALQSLPALMESTYECSDQIFNRFFANRIASSLLDNHPQIAQVFRQWEDTDALDSELQKKQHLKDILLEETPWVLDALSEQEQRKRLALLLNLDELRKQQRNTLQKLAQLQQSNGAFSWFAGGRGNWYLTNYLIAGFGQLKNLPHINPDDEAVIGPMVRKAQQYADQQLIAQYEQLLALATEQKINLEDNHLSPATVHYLYARSYWTDQPVGAALQDALDYYLQQAETYWLNGHLLQQAQIGQISQRMGNKRLARLISASLQERALHTAELGMYWKYQAGYFWYQSPIETHTTMMQFFAEMGEVSIVNELKIWLLKHKQTSAWPGNKATAAAIWALLGSPEGEQVLSSGAPVELSFPQLRKAAYTDRLEAARQQATPGTDQYQVSWQADEISPALATIKVKNPNEHLAWGAAYWQYFEDLDKVQIFQETPLQLEKQLYLSQNTAQGPQLSPVTADTRLHPGDRLVVRIQLTVDRDMEFIHLKDMRASGLEPLNVKSTYQWQGGLGYYETTKDLATHFFFDYLPKGEYQFEYPLRVQLIGDFSNGIGSIESMYAPEFKSHSAGERIRVYPK